MKAEKLRRLLNWYPPYLGAGIRCVELADDFHYARMTMPLRWYNRNYVGTHFGGSLYSMCDPLYMLMLLNILGRDFIVWDKAANIEYRRPGKGKMTAEFRIDPALITNLRALKPDEKTVFEMNVDVLDENDEVVAVVTKTEYVRRKS